MLTLGGVAGVAIAFNREMAIDQVLDAYPLSILSGADRGVWITD